MLTLRISVIHIAAALGADENAILCEQVCSLAALARVLEFVNAECLSLIEVVLPKMDIPALLQTITQSLENCNTIYLVSGIFNKKMQLKIQFINCIC